MRFTPPTTVGGVTRDVVYKILPSAEWAAAQAVGTFTGSPVDDADGYIHLSGADQVAETASRHFAGRPDLVLLAVDVARLGPALRWERSRGGQIFPHLYGSLPVDAVVAQYSLDTTPPRSAEDLAAAVEALVPASGPSEADGPAGN